MLLGHIGVAVGDETLDQRLHLRDMLGRTRLDRRRQHAERRDVRVELLQRAFGDLADRHAALRRAGIDLVVHVGDVADIGDVLRPVEVAQKPEQQVEDDDRARVADMRVVVDRRPADIHPYVRRIDRDEVLLRPRLRVVELQARRHAEGLPCPRAGGRFDLWNENETAPASGER
jgi:hypothetical protein